MAGSETTSESLPRTQSGEQAGQLERPAEDASVLNRAGSRSSTSEGVAARAEAAATLQHTLLRRASAGSGATGQPLPTLVVQFDEEQRVRAANESTERWFGKPESALLQQTLEGLLGEEFQSRLSPFVEQVLSGKAVAFEAEGPAAFAGSRLLKQQLIPLRDSQNRVGGFCAIFEDVAVTIPSSDSQLQSALSAGAVGAWSWDLDKNVINCDEHMWRMFDGAAEDSGRFLDSVHPEDRRRVSQAMTRSITEGTHEVVYRVVSEDRPPRHVASRGSAVETRDGRTVRVAGVCFDITHRMRTEEELRRLNATLEYQRATALSLMRDAEEEMFRAAHAREDVRRHQQFLDSIVENIPSMVFVKDAEELRFLHANKATEQLLGLSRDELIGKREFDLLPEEQAVAVTRVEQEVIRSKQEISIPEQIVETADQGRRILHTRKLPILDDEGNPRYLLAISEDITDRKLAEEALAKERSLLRTVIDNLPDYIFAKDTQTRFILNNRAHAQFVGAHFAADVLGKSDQDFMPHDAAARCLEDDHRVLHGGEQMLGKEEPVLDRSGAWRWLSTTKVPLKRPDGKVIGLVGLSRDITEHKKAAERMERMMGELARSNGELEQFAYVASHDLQEPLRKIQAFSSRLRDRWGEQLGEQGADYLNRVENAAARMQILIEDLLSYSRVTSKAKPFVPVELGEVVVGVLSDLEARIERLNAKVEVGELPRVAADPTQMRQLLQNLIGNALKFHRKDSTPVVRIRAEMPSETGSGSEPAADGVCQLFVEDNGIGFEPKHAVKIFQVFQRLHSRQEYQGSGIGLAVCKKIVDRHGGTIEARSAPGEGATFVVSLPLKQAEEAGGSDGEAEPS
ncbi:MAG: PAS domain-containing protein [Bryobacterales bacterium]